MGIINYGPNLAQGYHYNQDTQVLTKTRYYWVRCWFYDAFIRIDCKNSFGYIGHWKVILKENKTNVGYQRIIKNFLDNEK